MVEMVGSDRSVSVCNPFDHLKAMAGSFNPTKPNRTHQSHRNRKVRSSANCARALACDGSRTAAMDVAILIAVVVACGFLLFPYVEFARVWLTAAGGAVASAFAEEVPETLLIYGSIGLSLSCVAVACWLLLMYSTRRCGNTKCKGLRKAAEFDIQLETEECVKSDPSSLMKGGFRRGIFELPRDHHRELEAELKKMAPPNGRAVLIFRARCGCAIGRLAVPGPKKQRRIRK